jgi:hypothetical protein
MTKFRYSIEIIPWEYEVEEAIAVKLSNLVPVPFESNRKRVQIELIMG